VNGVKVATRNIRQGAGAFDVAPFLTEGVNTVRVQVARQIVYPGQCSDRCAGHVVAVLSAKEFQNKAQCGLSFDRERRTGFKVQNS
jgi:hypothetical protein